MFVGAGFAGISAAQEFNKNGIAFWISEATDRVGGRMFGGSFGKDEQVHIEYGANWIEELTGNNPVWALATKYGLNGSMTNFDNALIYDEKGYLNMSETNFVSGSNCGRAADAYYGLEELSSYCLWLSPGDPYLSQKTKTFCLKTLGANFKPTGNDDVTCEKGELLSTGFYPPNETNPAVARVCEWYYLDFDEAEMPSRLSTKNTVPPDLTGRRLQSSNEYFVRDQRGYKWLVERIGATFLTTSTNTQSTISFNDPRLNLNMKVVQIQWDPKGMTDVLVTLCQTAKSILPNSPILYPCASGVSFVTVTAKYFVSTFSLGVLKASVAQELSGTAATLDQTQDVAPVFVPALSSIPALARAIPAIGYSLYQKIFFQFPFTFWPEGVDLFLTAYASGKWVGDFAPAWLSLDLHSSSDPRYFPGSKVLMLTVTSDRAVELSSLTDSAIIAQTLPVLNLMFGKNIKAANGGSLLTISDVLDFYLYRWHDDPLYRGAYSSDLINAPVELLGDRYGNLVFSGEVTCHEHNGFVHGAYMAGIRSARLLMSQKLGIKGLNLNSACNA